MLRLARAARDTGLRSIAVVDGDTAEDAKKFVEDNQGLADTVVRLPDGAAIEVALLRDLPDDVVRQALVDVAASAGLSLRLNLGQLSGKELATAALSFIKNNSLHSPFIEALPEGNLPPLAVQVLNEAVQAATGATTGVIQL